MKHVTDFIYQIEEYEVPDYPGLLILNAHLSISVYRLDVDLEYCIDAVQLEKADGSSESFTQGSFIYDAIVPHIYRDDKKSSFILSEAYEHI